MGIGSCVRQLTFAALRNEIDAPTPDKRMVAFWVEAAVGLCYKAGRFETGWLEDFNKMFFAAIQEDRDAPSPDDMEISSKTRCKFAEMLVSAVAFAENKGKVGKVKLGKSTGYDVVKNWASHSGWRRVDSGFTEADRQAIQKLTQNLAQGLEALRVEVPQSCGRAVSETLRGRFEKVSELESRCKSAEDDVYREHSKSTKLEAELADARKRMGALEDIARDREITYKRDIARLEDEREAERVRLEESVRPIKLQFSEAEGMEMTVELGNAMKAQLGRILKILKDN